MLYYARSVATAGHFASYSKDKRRKIRHLNVNSMNEGLQQVGIYASGAFFFNGLGMLARKLIICVELYLQLFNEANFAAEIECFVQIKKFFMV